MIAAYSGYLKRHLGALLLITCGCCWVVEKVVGQEQPADVPRSIVVELGFNGQWKLGQVCPIKLTFAADLPGVPTRIEIGTVDGRGDQVFCRE